MSELGLDKLDEQTMAQEVKIVLAQRLLKYLERPYNVTVEPVVGNTIFVKVEDKKQLVMFSIEIKEIERRRIDNGESRFVMQAEDIEMGLD